MKHLQEPFQITAENMALPRTHGRIGPLAPVDTDSALRGRGTFGAHGFDFEVRRGGGEGVLVFSGEAPPAPARSALVDAVFSRFSEMSTIELRAGTSPVEILRHAFYQEPEPWHYRGDRYPLPLSYRNTGDIRHPARTKPTERLLYRRYCAGNDKTFSLRTFSFDEHFELFCSWMNDPEVAHFWELAHEPSRLRDYLRERIEDPHVIPMIGYFDDDAFAYFEVYWSKEDRLGPYYDANDYDRGFHMAVGDARYRFQGHGRYWFLSMAHFLFLDDPRTMQLVGEPRVDQARVRGWSKTTPWEIVKEFDFPHKRAVLMTLSRERFFGSFQI